MKVPGHLLRDRLTIARYTGSGAYGDAFGTPQEGVKAHVEPKRRLVVTGQGQEAMADATAYIRPEVPPVPVGSRVDWGGVPYRVMHAGAWPSEVRPAYRELILMSGG